MTSIIEEIPAVFVSTDEGSFAVFVFLALSMTMRAGVGGGAASFSGLWVKELLVAEVVSIGAAVVVKIPALVFL